MMQRIVSDGRQRSRGIGATVSSGVGVLLWTFLGGGSLGLTSLLLLLLTIFLLLVSNRSIQYQINFLRV